MLPLHLRAVRRGRPRGHELFLVGVDPVSADLVALRARYEYAGPGLQGGGHDKEGQDGYGRSHDTPGLADPADHANEIVHRPIRRMNLRHLAVCMGHPMKTRIIRTIAATLLLLTPGIPAADKPNILFIIVDDQSPLDLGIYNPASSLHTPHIDALAAGGMVLDGAHHMGSFSGAVCTPSRHMVMSGRTVWHLPNAKGAIGKGLCPEGLENHTMAAVFEGSGYETMRTCKRGNSYEGANEQFGVRHDATKRGGTDETGSAWHAEQVLAYLEDRSGRESREPFLIYYGFSHPHDVRDGKPELLAKYGATNHRDKGSLPPAHPKQPGLPENYLPEHPFHHGHPGLRDEVSVSGVWERRDERTIRNELGREFACSENIDIQIGRSEEHTSELQSR